MHFHEWHVILAAGAAAGGLLGFAGGYVYGFVRGFRRAERHAADFALKRTNSNFHGLPWRSAREYHEALAQHVAKREAEDRASR